MGSLAVLVAVMISAVAMMLGTHGLNPADTGSVVNAPSAVTAGADRAAGGALPLERPTSSRPAPSGGSTPLVSYYPNPTRDWVTFEAKGICWCAVDGLRVSVHDGSGALVEVLESKAPRLRARLVSGSGLVNGLYIARLEMRIDGVWTPLGTSLLAVLR